MIGETAANVIGVVPLAMSYVAAFSILWLRPSWQPLLACLASAGRMALTCYLTRTLIVIGLFYGLGFEDAYAARAPGTVVAGDPFFSELATERRYRELMARLRLPVQG